MSKPKNVYYQKKDLPEARTPDCPPHRDLTGQTAIVTGGSSGIGRAIALALGQAGANVVVNYHGSPDKAEKVAVHIRGFGVDSYEAQADVSEESAVARLFEQTIERFGTVDILVNNAGLQKDAPIDEMTLEQWNRVISVNLTGQFLCARQAIREFKRRGVRPEVSVSAGKILCISSVHDVIPWAGHVNYSASKAGVSMMMKSIAQEVAGHRIRVNAIAPGAVRTSINTQAWNTPQAYEELMELVPYNRIGEPSDIGRAAVWLVSDQSDYVVGATLVVDGGMQLYPGFSDGG